MAFFRNAWRSLINFYWLESGTKTLVVYMKTEITIPKDKKWMVYSVNCVFCGRMRKESFSLKKKQLKKCHHMNQTTTRAR